MAPPATTSQTSLPSQTGPIVSNIDRALALVARQERQQHPDAEVEALEQEVARPEEGDRGRTRGSGGPSVAHHRRRAGSGAALRLADGSRPRVAAHQPEVDDEERDVERDEDAEADPEPGRAHARRVRLARQEQALHDPRLAAHLGQHPAGGRGDERERDRDDRRPEEPARPLELLPPVEPRADGGDQEHQHARVRHPAHRPVDRPHVRHVVAAAVLAVCSCALELVEALRPVPLNEPVARYERSSRDRDREARRLVVLGEAADLEEREAARLAGVPLRLGGGDLHRAARSSTSIPKWLPNHELQQRDRHGDDQRQLRRRAEQLDLAGRAGSASSRRPAPRPTRRSARRGSCARTRAARTRSRAAPRRS